MRPGFVASWIICAVAIVAGCKSTHRIDGNFDLRDADRKQEIRISDTKPVDSVNINALKVDVWKIENWAYPDSIRMFVRVIDTTGYVVTHMADPYKKPGAPNYFTNLTEQIGVRRRKRDITVDEFKVREFGDKDSIPTAIALALDYSGSMKGARSSLEMGTEIFVKLLRPCDKLSLTAFHKEIIPVFPLESDTAVMMKGLRDLKTRPQGLFTSSLDGITAALKTLKNLPKEMPKVCVVFADGDENTSNSNFSNIIEFASKNNISIYCVGFGYALDEPLENLSMYTGGKYYRAYTKAELIGIFLDIYRSLKNYYLVTYRPPLYDGLHKVALNVSVPGREVLTAHSQYDQGGIMIVDGSDPIASGALPDNWWKNTRPRDSSGRDSGDSSGKGLVVNTPKDPNTGKSDPRKGFGLDGGLGVPNSKNEFTRPILFQFNKSAIDVTDSNTRYVLDELYDDLERLDRVVLEIQGHTDDVGTEEYNLKLSEERAMSVKNALVERGIDPERLFVKGYGFTMPIAPNTTEENKAKNRRTVFRVLRR